MLGFGIYKFNKSDIYLVLVLIPFMHPRGFSEYFAAYKNFFTAWLYIVVCAVFIYFIFKILRGHTTYKEFTPFILIYFGYLIFITLFIQGNIKQGIQKVFVTPALCLFCIIMFKQKIIQFIRCLAIVLIVSFVLNITVFSPWMCPNYFNVDEHLIFIGHVQIAAQLGILGIYVGYFCRRYISNALGVILTIMSIITMIMSDTIASKIAIVLFIVFYAINKLRMARWILYIDARYYIYIWLIVNFAMLGFYILLNGNYVINGIDFTLSGRSFVWKNSIELIKQSLLTGYGVYGILIKVFWSTGEGMNYAHNEVLQRLLDGGILSLMLFVILLCFIVKGIKKVKDKSIQMISNACLLILLVLMLIESVTDYYYVFIFFMLYAHVYDIKKKEGKQYGTYCEFEE